MNKSRQSFGLYLLGCDGAGAPEAFERPPGYFAKTFLNLAKACSIGSRSGLKGGRNRSSGSGGFNRDFDGGASMSAEVVHDHYFAGAQRPGQFLFDVSCELLSVDRSIEDARRGQAVVAQGGKEGRRFPMTEWRVADQPFADLTPAIARRHVRGRPGFIDENKLPGVECRLLLPHAARAAATSGRFCSAAQSVFS